MKDQLIAGAAGTAMLAIALLTPDDLGSTMPNQFSVAPVPQSSRACQNTWLEIRWFRGRMGVITSCSC